ncbi:DUF4236 domain-containing protein [Weissella diestrammenae]|uniref:DUF4236 domain-containing protein n=1 Tax=Weissella diestrammenae TaxID=1162633 RepID=A0A7G9T4F4_9LACO|nr:DUF4236 domain-containing protein [Weissella diestrammenae]MCM0583515.1 DUF4236 domain-containing protein [Weissella diestrammenae]QNN74979.1 DUF4236 domain-containing protein [Weissella diestrammenae]
MGFRFRKSINLGGGAKLNFSKSGIGWSFGSKNFRYTKKASGGTRTTSSIPGTGISYVKDSSSSKSNNLNQLNRVLKNGNTNNWWFWFLVGIISLLASYFMGQTSVILGVLLLIISGYIFINSRLLKKEKNKNAFWILLISISLIVVGTIGYSSQHSPAPTKLDSISSSSTSNTTEDDESESIASSISESESIASESVSVSVSMSIASSEAESSKAAESAAAYQSSTQASAAAYAAQTQPTNRYW